MTDASDPYSTEAGQAPAGSGRKRARPGLSEYVPIRFHPNVIAKVRVLADRSGVTVSSWIRRVVESEVERLLPDDMGTSSGADPRSRGIEWGQAPVTVVGQNLASV